MRAYLAIASRSFQQMVSYRFEAWLGMLVSLSETATYVALWYAVSRGDPDTLSAVLSYVMATRVLREVQVSEIFGQLQTAIRTGSVALELLKPLPYGLRLVADSAGRSLWRLIRTVPFYLVIGWYLDVGLPARDTLLFFAVSALLSWAVGLLLDLIAASIIFFVLDIEGVHNVLEFCRTVFAGALIPLWLLPDWFVTVADLLPFQAALYIPGAIFAGKLAGGALAWALARQVLWVMGLSFLALQMWRRATRKLVVQGG